MLTSFRMLTIFTIPKAFEGHNGTIQRNALESWTRLDPSCEVILCADDPGVAEIAEEFKVKHLPDIPRNEHGTPYLNSAFDQVKKVANNNLLCYVNADIILFSDFIRALKRIELERFMMVGMRHDLDLERHWEFQSPDWEERLRSHVNSFGMLHPAPGIDYFVFPRDGEVGKLPPFVVGRGGWDHWFVYHARKLGLPVVDVTDVVLAVHQNHGYNHIANRTGRKTMGSEQVLNDALRGDRQYAFTLLDATHVMTSRGVSPKRGYRYLLRRWQTLPILHPHTRPFVQPINKVVKGFLLPFRLAKRVRFSSPT